MSEELCARCGCYRSAHGEGERCEPVGWTFTPILDDTGLVEMMNDAPYWQEVAAIGQQEIERLSADNARQDALLQSLRTWVRGLPHDMESRPQVLSDIDQALSNPLEGDGK